MTGCGSQGPGSAKSSFGIGGDDNKGRGKKARLATADQHQSNDRIEERAKQHQLIVTTLMKEVSSILRQVSN